MTSEIDEFEFQVDECDLALIERDQRKHLISYLLFEVSRKYSIFNDIDQIVVVGYVQDDQDEQFVIFPLHSIKLCATAGMQLCL